jgi:transposase
MDVVKYSIGIDVSHETFTACVCHKDTNENLFFSDVKEFKNSKTGFNQLTKWVSKVKIKDVPFIYLMEATGVYYEDLAYHLDDLKYTVSVALPNTTKNYFKSLNIKSKTDKIDAKVLSQFGVERKHKQWKRPDPIYLKLRNLTRYQVQLQEQKTALLNIKHSKEESHEVQNLILQSNKNLIKAFDSQIKSIEKQIEKLIENTPELRDKFKKVLSIPGVGSTTLAAVIAEFFGFINTINAKAAVSFCGYDVVESSSGTSVKGKTKISKKGNRYVRRALYFPSIHAIKYNPHLKANYERIVSKRGIKKIGLVALQRKLLVLIYTLWTKDAEWDSDYEKKKLETKSQASQDSNHLETS